MKVVKTDNSPISCFDLGQELDARGIPFNYTETGVIVMDSDYDEVASILDEMERDL